MILHCTTVSVNHSLKEKDYYIFELPFFHQNVNAFGIISDKTILLGQKKFVDCEKFGILANKKKREQCGKNKINSNEKK